MRNTISGLIAVYAIVMTVLFFGKVIDNRELQYHIRDYAITNGKYVPFKDKNKEVSLIRYYSEQKHVPINLILGIGAHEQGLGTHLFGVKKIAWDIIWFYPIEEWQILMCIRIVKEEMHDYAEKNKKFFRNDVEMLEWINKNRKAFTVFLAHRYCFKDRKNWAYWVNKHWFKYNKTEVEK